MDGDKLLVLVVDDDSNFREAICLVLEDVGFDTEQARDGVEAINRVFKEPTPDVVLVDMMMPRMDGMSFISAIRQSEHFSIPIILMTAADQRAVKLASMVRNISGMMPAEVLEKPTMTETVVDAINRSIHGE